MSKDYLRIYCSEDRTLPNDGLSQDWMIFKQLLSYYRKLELEDGIQFYNSIKSEISSIDITYIALLETILSRQMLGSFRDIEISLLQTKWDKLKDSDRSLLYHRHAEIMMEYTLNNGDKSEIQSAFDTYFTTPRSDIYFLNSFQLRYHYYQAKVMLKIGKTATAVQSLNKSLEYDHDLLWDLKIKNFQGILFGILGNYSKSTKLFANLLHKSTSLRTFYIRAQIFNNLSILSQMQDNFSQAQQYASYCIDLAKQYNFSGLYHRILYNQSNNLFLQGKFKDALIGYQFLRKRHQKLGNKTKLALCIQAIIACKSRQGKLTAAHDLYEEYTSLDEYIDQPDTIRFQINRADLFLQMGKIREVETILYKIHDELLSISSEELEAKYFVTKLKYLIYTDAYDKIASLPISKYLNYFRLESNHTMFAILKFYESRVNYVMGELHTASSLIEEALNNVRLTAHPIMHARFLFFKLLLLLKTDNKETIDEVQEELQTLDTKYDYILLNQISMISRFMIDSYSSVQSQDPEISWIYPEIDLILDQILNDTTVDVYLVEIFLTYLLNLLCTELPETNTHYTQLIIQKVEEIAANKGSLFLHANLHVCKATIAFHNRDLDSSSTWLNFGKDLALQGGFSLLLDQIAVLDLKLSRIQLSQG